MLNSRCCIYGFSGGCCCCCNKQHASLEGTRKKQQLFLAGFVVVVVTAKLLKRLQKFRSKPLRSPPLCLLYFTNLFSQSVSQSVIGERFGRAASEQSNLKRIKVEPIDHLWHRHSLPTEHMQHAGLF